MENNLSKILYSKVNDVLDNMKKNPDSITEEDMSMLKKLYSNLCKTMGFSEHSQWKVTWRVDKWFDTARKLAGFEPDEVVLETQNIILDSGANEMLKLIAGIGGTAYSSANSYIYVGTDSTAENAAQNGVLATGANRAYAKVDSGFPNVEGRTLTYQASFGDEVANFEWNEASIVNGTGPNAIAMNRKVKSLGTKTTGTWMLRIDITLTSI